MLTGHNDFSDESMSKQRKLSSRPLLAIFLTVFIDMLSFGMAIPDLQLRAEKFGAAGWVMGLLLASFSITQLIAAPILGRWSDIAGRRKVLLITCILTVACFLAYSQAFSLPIMFLSRIFAGISSANIGVAFAYVADTTEPEERAGGMGLIGAAFGLGFIFGPVLGAKLVEWGNGGPTLLGFVAAGLGVVNLIYVYLFLPEPQVVRAKASNSLKESFSNLSVALRTPGLGLLIALFFVANFAFSNLESTFFRLLEAQYRLTQSEGAMVLFVVGVVAAFMQGYYVRILTKKHGEVKLVRWGYLLQIPALAAVPFCPPMAPLLIGAAVLGFATGLSSPSINSLISRSAPPDMQGGISGVIQSAGALARILGPFCGSLLFDLRPSFPYLVAASLMIIPTYLAFRFRPKFYAAQEADGYSAAH